MLLALAWTVGSFDAISYLSLQHVFTANMTGNTILLGLALGQGQWLTAVRAAAAFVGFALGVEAGSLIVRRDKDHHWSPAVTINFGLEALLLLSFVLLWEAEGGEGRGAVLYGLIALAALAMGMQSAAMRHLKLPGITTTAITGTLTSLMTALTGRTRLAPERSADERDPLGLQVLILAIYGLAAGATGWLEPRGLILPLLPLAAIVGVVSGGVILARRTP
jgi:uncharacterized membrane protein YoaK (UPF0700 family)